MRQEIIRDLLRPSEDVGLAGGLGDIAEAVDRPSLPARPGAVVGVTLIGFAIDEFDRWWC